MERFWSMKIAVVMFALTCSCSCTSDRAPMNVLQLSGPFFPQSDAAFWLDADRVIFEGYGGNRPSSAEERELGTNGIYIWNTRTEAVELYRKDARSLCYSRGKISYSLARDENGKPFVQSEVPHFAGPIGQEARNNERRAFFPELAAIGCQRNVTKIGNDEALPLFPGDGFFTLYPPGKVFNIDHQLVVELIEPTLFSYLPWRDEYLFFSTLDPSRADSPWEITTYKVGDPVRKRRIEKPDLQGFFTPIMTRAGLLLIVTDSLLDRNVGDSGIYLFDEPRRTARLLRKGVINVDRQRQGNVSPDGCKLAYRFRENISAGSLAGGSQIFLEALDVCNITTED